MSKREKGAFIVLDGMPCTGKSTILNALEIRLGKDLHQPLHILSDPESQIVSEGAGGFAVLESSLYGLLREWRNHSLAYQRLNREQMAILYTMNRAALSATVRRFVGEGAVVLCDRWSFSTIAFQEVGLGVLDPLEKFLHVAKPDWAFILTTEYDAFLDRIEGRKDRALDVIDRNYWNAVAKRFEDLTHWFDNTTLIQTRSLEETTEAVYIGVSNVLRGLGCL